MVSRCSCGFEVAKRTSWTTENPGRKFLACKFYNHETGHKGCKWFEWVDEGMTEWQREVTNKVIADKQRVAFENSILQSRLACETYEKDRLASELEKMKEKFDKLKTKMMMKPGEGAVERAAVVNRVKGVTQPYVFVFISVILSFIVMKVFG